MHDPMTQAFEIKYPWKRKSQLFPEGYADPFITIWHVDTEADGSDDACGWFMRSRHGDKEVLAKIEKAFAFEWDSDHGGWFKADGQPRLSVMGVTLEMFRRAAFVIYKNDWRKSDAFMERNLSKLLMLAENNVDSIWESLTLKYGHVDKEDRVKHFASVVYGWILRAERPWYKHPRWHFWHWQIQIHPLQQFKRWAFSRCKTCGKGFSWGYSPVCDSWESDGPRWFKGEPNVRHGDCATPVSCTVEVGGS